MRKSSRRQPRQPRGPMIARGERKKSRTFVRSTNRKKSTRITRKKSAVDISGLTVRFSTAIISTAALTNTLYAVLRTVIDGYRTVPIGPDRARTISQMAYRTAYSTLPQQLGQQSVNTIRITLCLAAFIARMTFRALTSLGRGSIYSARNVGRLVGMIYDAVKRRRDRELAAVPRTEGVDADADYDCVVCMEPTNYMTNCRHNLCLGCAVSIPTLRADIMTLGAREVRGNGTFNCPICRRELRKPSEYRNGTYVNTGGLQIRGDRNPAIVENPIDNPDGTDPPVVVPPAPVVVPPVAPPIVPPPAPVERRDPMPALLRRRVARGARCQLDQLAYDDPDAYLQILTNRELTPCNGLRRTVCRAGIPEWSSYGIKCEDVPHCEWRNRGCHERG